jgi:hypothetical protein
MTTLKIGDRVRVTIRKLTPRYQPGDKGSVTRGPLKGQSATNYFKVSMDKDKGKDCYGDGADFADYEIELDV